MPDPQAAKPDAHSAAIAAFNRGQRLSAWLLALLTVAVIVVALQTMIAAEDRWQQLDALNRGISRVESRLNKLKDRAAAANAGLKK